MSIVQAHGAGAYAVVAAHAVASAGTVAGPSAGASAAPSLQSEIWGEPAREPLQVIQTLKLFPAGKKMLESGVRYWNLSSTDELARVIRFGGVSKTDAVLTRQYDPETGRESRKREVSIILKSNQALLDGVLDLAHELTHATSEPGWDPYDPTLTVGRYIYALLESSGGEIDAVQFECQVASEIETLQQIKTKRCDRYFAEKSKLAAETLSVDRSRIQKDFYRIGRWSTYVKGKLKDETKLFPFLSPMNPELYSATGRAPYPAALIQEYEELNRVACRNAATRKAQSRGIASVSMSTGTKNSEFMANRCGNAFTTGSSSRTSD
ncbi:MAG: hypothetical protein EOP09_10755 [Proteobacteria bacterium]|nr:MAG: hypothetical protein EOP09_10755 [Pseudomonadota bacterium]